MCFSATASFSAAALLSVISVMSIREVWLRRAYRLLPLALVPVLFALQQASEGVIWLLLNGGNPEWLPLFTAIFITFAYVVWPTWMGVAFAAFEPESKRRKVLWGLAGTGLWLSALYSHYLLQYGVVATVQEHHVCYASAYLDMHAWFWGVPYLLVTAAPFFISSIFMFKWMGLLLVASCLITVLFWLTAFTSVWCFFAAILSVFILYALRSKKLYEAIAPESRLKKAWRFIMGLVRQ